MIGHSNLQSINSSYPFSMQPIIPDYNYYPSPPIQFAGYTQPYNPQFINYQTSSPSFLVQQSPQLYSIDSPQVTTYPNNWSTNQPIGQIRPTFTTTFTSTGFSSIPTSQLNLHSTSFTSSPLAFQSTGNQFTNFNGIPSSSTAVISSPSLYLPSTSSSIPSTSFHTTSNLLTPYHGTHIPTNTSHQLHATSFPSSPLTPFQSTSSFGTYFPTNHQVHATSFPSSPLTPFQSTSTSNISGGTSHPNTPLHLHSTSSNTLSTSFHTSNIIAPYHATHLPTNTIHQLHSTSFPSSLLTPFQSTSNQITANFSGTPVPLLPQHPVHVKPILPQSHGKSTFLIGDLELIIHQGSDLPNHDANKLTTLIAHKFDRTDSYVRINVNGKKGPRTKTINNSLNPVWNERFLIRLSGEIHSITLDVKDDDMMAFSEPLGSVSFGPTDFLQTPIVNQWFPLVNKKGAILISARFYDASRFKEVSEVPESKFQQRKGCKVTLYQDAHVEDGQLPNITIGTGQTYENHKCWKELYSAINEARIFIYITGWSVWTALEMVRGESPHPTLGELLKEKSKQGVKIRIMVWDDFTSMDSPLAHALLSTTKAGLMGTFDQETKRYFKDTGIICELIPRYAKGYSETGNQEQGNIHHISAFVGNISQKASFTHHQKSVILDAAAEGSNQRRIIAFVGGLDLTAGRYDTPHHPLFSTLNTIHSNDFYNGIHPTFTKEGGPREPWHDIHCKVEGPVARDVLQNFQDRWLKQAHINHRKDLLDLQSNPMILPVERDTINGKGSWSCQLFRSIDSMAAINVADVEAGILNAYVHQIRRAEKFIYIENQYFLGSSSEWNQFDDKNYNIEAKHRIPLELAMKIVSKIRDGQRFALYILVPIHPEGVPEAAAVQAILFWQSETIKMMYKKIADAIAQYGPKGAKPTDYMNVYCLGNKEPGFSTFTTTMSESQNLVCRTRRHMVYVHSKMMIVDDDYIIVGSANINQRSMGGNRDTEIAVGCLEEGVRGQDELGHGQVSGFRQSLWSEHLGKYLSEFGKPDSLQCVNTINKMAEENWKVFSDSSDIVSLPHGHLLKYPYNVNVDGDVTAVVQYIPDSEKEEALVMGRQPPVTLQLLTT